MVKMTSVVAALVAFATILYFGMAVIAPLMDAGDDSVSEYNELQQPYSTTKEITATTFSFSGSMIYVFGLLIVIVGLSSLCVGVL